MPQNHLQTSSMTPQSTPKHIWELFFSGHFSPKILKKRLSPQTRHCRVAQTKGDARQTVKFYFSVDFESYGAHSTSIATKTMV